jgi:hypothetical protein
MKALSLAIQKIWPMLKFLQTYKQTDRDRQMDRRTGQKQYAPDLSIRGHKNQWIKTKLTLDLYCGMAKQCTKYQMNICEQREN